LVGGKVAVITGAGSGIAKASTKLFVSESATVVAADISGAEKETAAEVGNAVRPASPTRSPRWRCFSPTTGLQSAVLPSFPWMVAGPAKLG
jgi:NAD(P)-dependent dehydrogenase (short-subunit alcohol dehydrogenase family)